MATTAEETVSKQTDNIESPDPVISSDVPYCCGPPSSQPVTYKNAREYAQVLRPWLWQYYTMATMHQLNFLCPPPPYINICLQSAGLNQQGSNNASGAAERASGDHFQRQVPDNVQARPPQRPANRQTPTVPHRFTAFVVISRKISDGSILRNYLPISLIDSFIFIGKGSEYRIPSFWKRMCAELIDFTILFYVKLVVTLVVMREMGFMEGLLDYDFLDHLEDLDYDRAFIITYEILAVELINRLLIAFFETLCLRQGIGRVGGATPGKRLMGLTVISCTNIQDLGNHRVLIAPAADVGWFSAFIRSIIKNLIIAFFFPACLTVFLFRHNRTVYDFMANTIVVEADDL